MTQEDKELLLKDLSARLPYGIIVHIHDINVDDYDRQLIGEDLDFIELNKRNYKPYLRKMSSMTEEEYNKLKKVEPYYGLAGGMVINVADYYDWLNAHHFDYRGLIEKGLALEAPEGMY